MNRIIGIQTFDSTNGSRFMFATVPEAVQWVKREMQSHPEATYSLFRASTYTLLAMWAAGKLRINRGRGASERYAIDGR